MDKTRILIAIQARSTSHRLPGKALLQLHNKPILSWVLNACLDSAKFINRKAKSMRAEVFILCPAGDPIATFYSRSYTVVEGSLDNVLSRYVKAQQMRGFDYVVRVTGDCPFLSSFVITNHIFKAINHGYDYVSNVDPEVRTELDGRDVEVLSSLALEWLDEHATTDEDKEHVTTLIRKVRPKVLRRAHLLSRIDISDMKLSIDTPEDFKNSERRINSFFEKRKRAEEDVGIDNVFYC